MRADVVLLPKDLSDVKNRAVVVLDVLRASTTMIAALAAGVSQIRVFADTDSARLAAAEHGPEALLCGEVNCLPPPGFDLGNSPGSFGPHHAGRLAFLATTNGTRAILAAQDAKAMLIGALVNAAAVADRLLRVGLDVLLLCAGTNGSVAIEDALGAGAVLAELNKRTAVEPGSDVALMASQLFAAATADLRAAITQGLGGQNVIAAGLAEDIDFASRLNAIDLVAVVNDRVVRNSHP